MWNISWTLVFSRTLEMRSGHKDKKKTFIYAAPFNLTVLENTPLGASHISDPGHCCYENINLHVCVNCFLLYVHLFSRETAN